MMLEFPLLLPVYFTRKRVLWESPLGLAALSERLKTIAAEHAFIVSDEERVLSIARSYGLTGLFQTVHESKESSLILPYGSQAALAALHETTGYIGPVAVVDFRNSRFAAHDLVAAKEEFKASKARQMVSIAPMRDHPCQLEALFDLVASGYIHSFVSTERRDDLLARHEILQKTGEEAQDFFVTRRFAFDWALRGVEASVSRCFLRRFEADRCLRYHDFEATIAAGESIENQSIWVCEDAESARVLVHADRFVAHDIPTEAGEVLSFIGATMGDSSFSRVELYQNADGQSLFHLDKKYANQSLVLFPVDAPLSSELIVHKIGLDGCVRCTVPLETSFMYWILCESGGNASYDVSLPFPGEGTLWKTLTGKTPKINLKTGKVITGRQNFPEVFSPEGSVAIVPVDGYDRFDRELESGRCFGWLLPDSAGPKIESSLDLLHMQEPNSGFSSFPSVVDMGYFLENSRTGHFGKQPDQLSKHADESSKPADQSGTQREQTILFEKKMSLYRQFVREYSLEKEDIEGTLDLWEMQSWNVPIWGQKLVLGVQRLLERMTCTLNTLLPSEMETCLRSMLQDAFHSKNTTNIEYVLGELLRARPALNDIQPLLLQAVARGELSRENMSEIVNRYTFSFVEQIEISGGCEPMGVLFDAESELLYVTDSQSNTLRRVTLAGQEQEPLPLELKTPLGLIKDTVGIWICDFGNGRLVQLSPDNSICASIDFRSVLKQENIGPKYGCFCDGTMYIVLENRMSSERLLVSFIVDEKLYLNKHDCSGYTLPMRAYACNENVFLYGWPHGRAAMIHGQSGELKALERCYCGPQVRGLVCDRGNVFILSGTSVHKIDQNGVLLFTYDLIEITGLLSFCPLAMTHGTYKGLRSLFISEWITGSIFIFAIEEQI